MNSTTTLNKFDIYMYIYIASFLTSQQNIKQYIISLFLILFFVSSSIKVHYDFLNHGDLSTGFKIVGMGSWFLSKMILPPCKGQFIYIYHHKSYIHVVKKLNKNGTISTTFVLHSNKSNKCTCTVIVLEFSINKSTSLTAIEIQPYTTSIVHSP